MAADEITRIYVNRNQVGIVGLRRALEEAAVQFGDRPDEDVEAELMKRLASRNYIPPRVRTDYGRAFVRELRKFQGRTVREDGPGGLEIQVLGPGCPQCDRLESDVMAVLSELNLKAGLRHVTDVKEIGRTGVMGMPALLINGRVMAVGAAPPREKIKRWIEDMSNMEEK